MARGKGLWRVAGIHRAAQPGQVDGNWSNVAKEPVIRFEAIVNNVKTLTSDNTIRVTLDLPETAIDVMAMLAQTKVDGIVLDVTVKAKAG